MTHGSPDTPDLPPLSVTLARQSDNLTIAEVVGDVDHSSADVFYDGVVGLAADHGQQVILDFSGVPFCDSSGISALVTLVRHLEALDGTLTLAAPVGNLTRALSMAGLSDAIPTEPSVAAAIAALRPWPPTPPHPDSPDDD